MARNHTRQQWNKRKTKARSKCLLDAQKDQCTKEIKKVNCLTLSSNILETNLSRVSNATSSMIYQPTAPLKHNKAFQRCITSLLIMTHNNVKNFKLAYYKVLEVSGSVVYPFINQIFSELSVGRCFFIRFWQKHYNLHKGVTQSIQYR